jgi:ubiquinone/menaquinone biosynthesis C-methylase UbiE
MRVYILLYVLTLGFLLAACSQPGKQLVTSPALDSIYRNAPIPNPDGTGRLYMGREIAQTMSHYGAAWLDRAERIQEERTDLLVKALASRVKPTDAIADIGAGSGYMSFRLAPLVPQGTIYAVDIQPEMLALIQSKKEKNRMENVQTVLGTLTDPKLPEESTDWVLLVDAYHEFSNPYEMMLNVTKTLKPSGKVVLVEYRGEDANVPIKLLHKMTQQQAKKEMEAVGLHWVETQTILPWQHLMIFQKE